MPTPKFLSRATRSSIAAKRYKSTKKAAKAVRQVLRKKLRARTAKQINRNARQIAKLKSDQRGPVQRRETYFS